MSKHCAAAIQASMQGFWQDTKHLSMLRCECPIESAKLLGKLGTSQRLSSQLAVLVRATCEMLWQHNILWKPPLCYLASFELAHCCCQLHCCVSQ